MITLVDGEVEENHYHEPNAHAHWDYSLEEGDAEDEEEDGHLDGHLFECLGFIPCNLLLNEAPWYTPFGLFVKESVLCGGWRGDLPRWDAINE